MESELIINFFNNLRASLAKKHKLDYFISGVYNGNISFIQFTPRKLKSLNLKVLIVLNHEKNRFEIWLSGRNKETQLKYWEIFRQSNWNKYSIPENLDGKLSIVEYFFNQDILEESDANKIELIENELVRFTDEITTILTGNLF